MFYRIRDHQLSSIALACLSLLGAIACEESVQPTAVSPVTPGIPAAPPAAPQMPIPTGVAGMTGGVISGGAAAPVLPAAPIIPPPAPSAAGSAAPTMMPGPGAPAGGVPRCTYVRKNAKKMTAAERDNFVKAVLKLKEMPSPYDSTMNYYDQFVYWHIALQYCDPKSNEPMMMGHGAPMFLPWHREHLILFDEALNKVSDEPIATPYWDWTDQDINSIFNDDFMGGNGDRAQNGAVMTGPFKMGAFIVKIDPPGLVGGGSPFVQRFLGNAATLPTPQEVQDTLKIPTYDAAPWNLLADVSKSFRNRVEGNTGMGGFTGGGGNECPESGVMPLPIGGVSLHNRIHSWVNGSMLTAASPNDPVFWLHHCNTDRLWWEWQKMHGIDTYLPVSELPKNSLNDVMMPFMEEGIHVTPAMVADSEKLGVCYE